MCGFRCFLAQAPLDPGWEAGTQRAGRSAAHPAWTLSCSSAMGLAFVGIAYVDGRGFVVPKKLVVKSAIELNGASVWLTPPPNSIWQTTSAATT
jgi:hypothetical protein